MGSIKPEPWRRINLSRRKAISPVIASVILSGMVLAIGGMVWSYSYGAASFVATDYTNTTTDMVNTIAERFSIEHAYYDSSTEDLTVWIYNYGSIQITADITVTVDDTEYYSYTNVVDANSVEEALVILDVTLVENDDLTITIETERGNTTDEIYYVS